MVAPRVLIVDDEEALLTTIAANLDLEGFTIVEASSGERALELLDVENVDLVLSDIRMPGMNGVELYRAIRARGIDVPVVLMTAFAMEDLVRGAVHEGVFAVLPKPFDMAKVSAFLQVAAQRPLVVIVDDEAHVAESTAACLRELGVAALGTSSCERALAAVAEGKTDVVVVDMVMPDLSGADMVERILTMNAAVTCIGISGYEVPEMFNRVAAKTTLLLRKPVPPTTLVATIAQARRRRVAQQ